MDIVNCFKLTFLHKFFKIIWPVDHPLLTGCHSRWKITIDCSLYAACIHIRNNMKSVNIHSYSPEREWGWYKIERRTKGTQPNHISSMSKYILLVWKRIEKMACIIIKIVSTLLARIFHFSFPSLLFFFFFIVMCFM